MSMYEVGTVTGAAGATTITGAGTVWTDRKFGISPASTIAIFSPGKVDLYAIARVDSDTKLTVTRSITAAFSNSAYGIMVAETQSITYWANQLTAALSYTQDTMSALNKIMTEDGIVTVIAPNGQQVTISSFKKMTSDIAGKADIVSGAVPISQGGTGARSAADARSNLGLGNSATRNIDNQFATISSYMNAAAVMAQVHRDFRNLASYDLIAQYPLGMSFGIQYGGNGWRGNSGTDTYVGMLTLRGWHDATGGGYTSWQLASTSQGLKYRQGSGTVSGLTNVSFSSTHTLYSTQNTTKTSDGTLKAASPVVKLFTDGTFETNDESEGCTVTRLARGEYLIEGSEGLNADAAWGGWDGGFDIPTDRNRQPLIWLDYDVNADGSVLVKTFHRTHPAAPAFARNKLDGVSDGDPVDIPHDQFVSVRVQMPQNSIWNQRIVAMNAPLDSSAN